VLGSGLDGECPLHEKNPVSRWCSCPGYATGDFFKRVSSAIRAHITRARDECFRLEKAQPSPARGLVRQQALRPLSLFAPGVTVCFEVIRPCVGPPQHFAERLNLGVDDVRCARFSGWCVLSRGPLRRTVALMWPIHAEQLSRIDGPAAIIRARS
jgi:hypothetical protein